MNPGIEFARRVAVPLAAISMALGAIACGEEKPNYEVHATALETVEPPNSRFQQNLEGVSVRINYVERQVGSMAGRLIVGEEEHILKNVSRCRKDSTGKMEYTPIGKEVNTKLKAIKKGDKLVLEGKLMESNYDCMDAPNDVSWDIVYRRLKKVDHFPER